MNKPGLKKGWEAIDDVFFDPERQRAVRIKGQPILPDQLPLLRVEFLDINHPPAVYDGDRLSVTPERAITLVMAYPSRAEDGQFYELLPEKLR